jgi:hypothetical protein
MAALTSLLVRDRVVSVHKIEEALQQQVLEGGEIDTVLLELEAAPEDVLAAYRAATFGLVPASRDELMSVPSEVLRILPKEVAEHFRVAPIAFENGKLIVGSTKPLPELAHRELIKTLKLPVEIRIATEVRVETALAVHYGIDIGSRIRRLADELERRDPGALPNVDPIGENLADQHEKNVIVDDFWATPSGKAIGEPAPAVKAIPITDTHGSHDEQAAPDTDNAPALRQDRLSDGPVERAAASGPFDELDTPKGVKSLGRMLSDTAPTNLADGVSKSITGAPLNLGRRISTSQADLSSPIGQGSLRPIRSRESVAPGIQRIGQKRRAITPGVFDELLRSARDRDAILETFFSYAEQLLSCAAIFAFREHRAFGMYGGGLDESVKIRAISLPLEEGSFLLEVQRSRFEGIINLSRSAADAGLVNSLKRENCQPAILLPVSIRRRPVLCLYGDCEGDRFGLDDVAEIIEVMPKVGAALEGIIQARKFADMSFKRAASVLPPSGSDAENAASGGKVSEKKAENAQVAEVEIATSAENPTVQTQGDSENNITRAQPLSELSDELAHRTEEEPTRKSEPVADAKQEELPKAETRERSARENGETGYQTTATAGEERQRRPRLGGIVSDLLQRFKPVQGRPSDHGTTSRPRERIRSEPSVVVNVRALTQELVDKLCNTDKGREGAIIAALGRAGEAAIPELVQRFPGPLWIKPRPVTDPIPAGRDVSAISRALLSFGDEAIEPTRELVSRSEVDIYYPALLVAREIPCEALLESVAKHLFDPEADIRRLTSEVLWQFRGVPGYDRLINSINEAISNRQASVSERVTAIEAIGGLRDCSNLQRLCSLTEDAEPALREAARSALVEITLQDFGPAADKWQAWITANQNRHRFEWLIESLMHLDESIRNAAGNELTYLTQQYFGYQASSSKSERERVQAKYREWWKANRPA